MVCKIMTDNVVIENILPSVEEFTENGTENIGSEKVRVFTHIESYNTTSKRKMLWVSKYADVWIPVR